MTLSVTARIARVIVPALLLASCASYEYQTPSQRSPGVLPTMSVDVTLVPDGDSGKCKKDRPLDALYGLSATKVTWNITNKCGRPVTVTIHSVKEKGPIIGGPFPFQEPPGQLTTNLADGETKPVTATVKDTSDVSQNDKGFHIYRYKFRTSPGSDDDPEIIIEWP
jgi:hypothetical protein